MKIRECDRCGIMESFTGERAATVREYILDCEDEKIRTEIRDLCGPCAKELRLWFTQPLTRAAKTK